MAKYFFLLILALSRLASGQGLTGKVIDATSKQPIPYASVRLLNTNIGTTCNEEGDFALANITLPSQLIVSELGHQGDTIAVPTAQVVRIALKPAPVVLPEVQASISLAKLLSQAYTQSRKLYAQKTYGKAFYRQITRQDNDPTEVLEIIWNTKTNNAGIEGAAVAQGRYAEKKAMSKLKNFSLLTRAYGLYDAQADTTVAIWMVGPNAAQYYTLNLLGVTQNGTQQLLEIGFASKPGVNPNHHQGSVTIDAATYHILRFRLETEDVKLSPNIAAVQYKNQHTVFEMVFQPSERGAPILNYVSVRYQGVVSRPHKEDVAMQVTSFTVFYDGQPTPSGDAYASLAATANQSDLRAIKRTAYNATFWAENSVIKRTPLEEGVIDAFEQKGAFGTLLKQ